MRTVGDCQALWEEFINRCSDDGKLFGIEHNELEESISHSGLNINAAEFVPTATAKTNQQRAADPSDSCSNSSSLSLQEDYHGNETGENIFPLEGSSHIVENDNFGDNAESRDKITTEFDIDDSQHGSDDAGDELSESDDLGNADDFAEYDNVDETVPPKYMDPIIQALKEKCEEKAIKRKLPDEANYEQNLTEGGKLTDEAEREKDKLELGLAPDSAKENGNKIDSNTAQRKIVHEDVQMKTKKGKTQVFLVNIDYKYSERTERLLRQPKVQEEECLQSDYLDQLLKDDPELYRECTLRVNYDGTRTSYGELHDAGTEDILIEGNTRQTFDRDVVVVKLSERPSSESTQLKSDSERLKGKICGIRHHALNLRERQFVCTISRDNPRVMYPINKTMTPIANLTDETCKGVPIYKKIQPGSGEKAVRVSTLSHREALSGKFVFVVQYLQWRRDFPYPLGIVTKTIRRGNDLSEAVKLLNAEYLLKEEFPEEITKEVQKHIEKWSSSTRYEKDSRQRVLDAFTIDPPGSKALDDALSVEEQEDGLYKVGVHIADVSYFVKEESKIDVEARRRGTTYFRGHRYRDVLMLPEELSHNICSLLPNQDRLAVSVYLVLDQDGRVQDEGELNFCRTIVKSQCRLTYADAQKVILGKSARCRPEDGEMTLRIQESIRTLSSLAQKRRKVRLSDGSYYHFDHADRKEDLEAHELVEEMMILANTAVARYLVERKALLAPLRIQLPPKTKKLNNWRESFGNCAQLSLSLRRHLPVPRNVECAENFVVPTPTWSCIRKARRKPDQRDLKLLLCNDNIFPQLAVAHMFLNGLQRKAEDVRAIDVEEEHRVHWSLNVREYTRFTSPIRRYLDIIVHRLLLETAGQHLVADIDDIAEVYRRCSVLSDKSSKCEKDFGRVEVAVKLKKESCEFTGIVEMIERDFIRLQLLSDANQYLSPNQRRIQINNLGPIEQPNLDESTRCLELKWKLRIYDASTQNIKRAKWLNSKEQQTHLCEDRAKIQAMMSVHSSDSRSGYRIPSSLWMDILDAVKEDDGVRLTDRLKDVDEIIVSERKESPREKEEERTKNSLQKELDHEDDKDGDHNGEKEEEDEEEEGEDEDEVEDEVEDEEEEEEEEEDEKETKEEEEEEEEDSDDAEEEDETAVHFIETSLKLKVADSVSVQLSANDFGGLMSPEFQLFNLAPGISICLEHRKLADKCFTGVASDQASQQFYRTINSYVHVWRPVLAMEAATVAIRNDDTLILQNIEVKWRKEEGRKFVGEFELEKNFCKTRQIDIFSGDYACVKVTCRSSLPDSEQLDRNRDFPNQMEQGALADIHACDISSVSHSEEETSSEDEDDKESSPLDRKAVKSCWVGHCTFSLADNSQMKYRLKLFQHSMEVPEGLGIGKKWICSVEIIKQTISSR